MTMPPIDDLLDGMDLGRNRRIAEQLLQSAFALLADNPDVLDLKIASAALEEMREAFKMFAPFHDIPKVTIFGSARTQTADPLYMQARDVAALLAEARLDGGHRCRPGDHAGRAWKAPGASKSIGVSIRLPFEQGANPVIAGDVKYVSMKYFFTRKLMLVKESKGFVCLPGGFGTLDETFELLTLTQTGKGLPVPIVFLDTPGDPYWETVHDFVSRQLIERGLVSPPTPSCTSSPTTARRSRRGDRLLPQLRLDPLRRRAHRHAHEAGPDRRAARRAQRAVRASAARTARSCAPRRSSRSARRTTSSTWPGSPSRSPSTRTATCAT